ncbi:MAG: hypothetical protein B7Z80_12505 [Rhodospirillales bacterium 20-64-7]|nr:MAG: hypothetical protein B7Z80_12505 [Rhodospirillales bacterium 20-64-7]HQT78072.1 hypothetical protein [Rhodopila sp.]
MSGSTTLTWLGGGDNLASDPNDWSPTGTPAPGDTLLLNTGTINLVGDILAGSTVSVDNHQADVGINVTGNATLNLLEGSPEPANATVDVAITAGSTLALTAFVALSTLLTNGGTIAFDGTNTFAAFKTVFDDDLTGSGTIQLSSGNAAGENMEINGAVGSGLTFQIQSGASDADLIIDKPQDFAGLIKLTPVPVTLGHIEFAGLHATNATLSNGILQLYDGNTLVDTVRFDNANQAVQLEQAAQGVFLTAGTSNDLGTLSGTAIPLSTQGTTANFTVQDETSGQSYSSAGSSYTGPVPGLTSEFVVNTSDIINVTANTPNVFIEVAPSPGGQPPSQCGINVSAVNGNNVLDGYANSNFYTGGKGTDQFYEDTRTLTQNSWSTIVNFHSGDNVTLWGVTPSDFSLNWIGDTYGAPGATGLTGVLVPAKAGQPDVGITLAGYTTNDFTNGKIVLSYGETQAQGGVPGSTYLSIHAT